MSWASLCVDWFQHVRPFHRTVKDYSAVKSRLYRAGFHAIVLFHQTVKQYWRVKCSREKS